MTDVHSEVPDMSRSSRRAPVALGLMLAILSLALGRPGAAAGAVETTDRAAPGVTLLSSDDNGLTLRVVVPATRRRTVWLDGVAFTSLVVDGYATQESPGWPAVPQLALWVALPGGATPSIDVLEASAQTVTGLQLAPTGEMVLQSYDADDPAAVPQFSAQRGALPEAYALDELYPAGPASFGPTTTLRGIRVAPLRIQPVLVNSARGLAQIYHNLTVRVRFGAGPARDGSDAPPRAESAAFQQLLANQVINYAQALAWPQAPEPSAPAPAPSPCLDNNAFRLTITETGMYRVTQASLAAAGLPTSVSADLVRMCQGDHEIAIDVSDGDADGQFEPGDDVRFYGEALRTQETDRNVYWLTYGGGVGLRIQQSAGNPSGATTPTYFDHTVRLESDNTYYSLIPAEDVNDHWYYPLIFSDPNVTNPNPTLSLEFPLSHLSGGQYGAPVRVEAWGFSSYETHTFRVRLNGTLVDTASFIGSGVDGAMLLFDRPADSQLLVDGTNNLTIEAVQNANGSHHSMLVNWADITLRRQFVAEDGRLEFAYPTSGNWNFQASGFADVVEIYDLSDPAQPQQITTAASGPGTVAFSRETTPSSRFAIVTTGAYLTPASVVQDTPSNLRSTSVTADYIIITDPSLNGALGPLVDARTADGLVVQTAYVQDVFDEFNYGIYSTTAIKNFLHHAYDQWSGGGGPGSPRPSFALLAGEGSYDHRDVLGLNGATGNLVPVYLRSGIDSNLGEAGADNQYVDFDGDNLPEMLLGRIPAADSAELSTVISKILAYEAAPPDPTWQKTGLFLVDNGFLVEDDCAEDPAGDFFWHIDNFLSGYFPAGKQYLRRIYYAPDPCYPRPEYPVYEPHFAASSFEATLRLLNAIESGNQIIAYIGHSSILDWGKEAYLTLDLVDQLSNGGRTPIELPMTCLTGFYHQPQGDSLSEALLELPGGGTVASFAPTGLQVQHGHDMLLQGFYGAAYDDGVPLLGQAIYGAKEHLLANDVHGQYQDLQDTFMLLGDPAMKLNLCVDCGLTFLPSAMRR